MDYARLFAYSTGVMFISLGAAIFIESIVPLLTGIEFYGQFILWAAVLILYFNLTFNVVKRFIRKEIENTHASDILAFIIFLIPLIYFVLRINFAETDSSIDDQTFQLISFLAMGVILGWRFGKKAGLRLQADYLGKLSEMIENQENSPEDLQRPHDSLNKN